MISLNDRAYIFLSALELSYKKMSDIISHYERAGDFFDDFLNNSSFLVEEFGSNFKKYKEKYEKFSFETFEKYLTNNNVGYITIQSDNYPPSLLNLQQPPLILYYKGDLSLANSKGIAIVGTRNPSFYGKDITYKFAKGLSEAGFTIVSGLSTGVDKISHETALKANGKTIAVLGNGLEKMYPAINYNLSKEIAQKGLLITEYYPTYTARSYSFPARNRIIAALSRGVLITEAAQKSGSLYTKDYALELGLDVFSVPGNITSLNSVGSNNIIKFGHAQCVTCVEDILNSYGINKIEKKQEKIQLNFDEQIIYNSLKLGEKSFDELQYYTNLSVQTLNTCLTTMQIRGIIKKLPGNYYSV